MKVWFTFCLAVVLFLPAVAPAAKNPTRAKYQEMLGRISRGECSPADDQIVEQLNRATDARIKQLKEQLQAAEAAKKQGERWREGFPASSTTAKEMLISVYNYEKYLESKEYFKNRLTNNCIVTGDRIQLILQKSQRGETWRDGELYAPRTRVSVRVLTRTKYRAGTPVKSGVQWWILDVGDREGKLTFYLTDNGAAAREHFAAPELPFWGDRSYIHFEK